MQPYRYARESTHWLVCVMILFGLGLILGAKLLLPQGTWRVVMETLGTTIVGVFAVSLIYQRSVAEKHFEAFTSLLRQELGEMDSIQSRCRRLGVEEIFATRPEYETQHPFEQIIGQCPVQSEVTAVGRTLFHLADKRRGIEHGLNKGLSVRLALIDPDWRRTHEGTRSVATMTLGSPHEIGSALDRLKLLLKWALEHKPPGSIEIKFHRELLLDSVLLFRNESGKETLVWDLSFGHDLCDKMVFLLSATQPLGRGLRSRYQSIYTNAKTVVKYSDGAVQVNELDWEFEEDTPKNSQVQS